ncbi:MAG: tetratricopeptide repeat protein, partial [Desulfobacterales bacterium]|nr:tetratricopeptide repeat protein [Desulfobacterales bacterium]
SLDDKLLEQVERNWGRCGSEEEKAHLLLKALVIQAKGKTVLFLDNLETLQDPGSGAVNHPALAAWLKAGARLGKDGPITLITSRWEIPAFEEGPSRHHPLQRPSYGDFLRFGQEFPRAGLSREKMKSLYENLGGNFKGLQLFCAARQMGADPDAFLERLNRTKEELRAYMAVEQTMACLNADERELLNRMRAYVGPVIEDGVRIIGENLPEPTSQCRRLAALSLLDTEFDPELRLRQHRLSPLIAEWLEKEAGPLSPGIVEKAARYQVYFFEKLQPTLDRALTAHAALTRAGLDEEAHRLVLKNLAHYFDRRGMFRTLLNVWLPPLLESSVDSIRGKALNWVGATHQALGDFDAALDYSKQSLIILRVIGDRAGEGATLNNISQIFKARGDYDTALDYL